MKTTTPGSSLKLEGLGLVFVCLWWWADDHFTWPERRSYLPRVIPVPYWLDRHWQRHQLPQRPNHCRQIRFCLTLGKELYGSCWDSALELPSPLLSSSSSHRIQPYEMARATLHVFVCPQNSAHSCAYILHLLPFEAPKKSKLLQSSIATYFYACRDIFDPVLAKFGGWSIPSIPFTLVRKFIAASKLQCAEATSIYWTELLFERVEFPWNQRLKYTEVHFNVPECFGYSRKAFCLLKWRFAQDLSYQPCQTKPKEIVTDRWIA